MQDDAHGRGNGHSCERTDEREHAGTDLSDAVAKVEQTDCETAEDNPVFAMNGFPGGS